MANNQNDESNGIIIVFAFLGAALYVWFAFLALLAAFVSLVFTILCLCAWNKPLRLGRKFVIEPDDARAFVYRGLIGAVAAPAFLIFVVAVTGIFISDQALLPSILVGYTLGSVGVEMMMANDQDQSAGSAEIIPPSQQLPAPPQSAREPQRLPFRFASWDDEDARR